MIMNSYELSRSWFNWCFENPEKINPNHTAMYFFIIEHCNRLGWKEKFGLPMEMTKDAIGIKNYRTYSNTLNDLIEWKFITLIQKSKNQYSSNIIAIAKNTKANTKALDKAMQKHSQKQVHDIVCIDKPINNKQINNITIEESLSLEKDFNDFWNAYGKKVDAKKCKTAYFKLSMLDRQKIKSSVIAYVGTTPDLKFRKNPLTWLNGRCWDDIFENEVEHTVPRNKPILLKDLYE